jgi:hypothetical protein
VTFAPALRRGRRQFSKGTACRHERRAGGRLTCPRLLT